MSVASDVRHLSARCCSPCPQAYQPLNTGFFKREKRGGARFTAEEIGNVVIDGLGLLAHGYPGVKLWEVQPTDEGFLERAFGEGFCGRFSREGSKDF